MERSFQSRHPDEVLLHPDPHEQNDHHGRGTWTIIRVRSQVSQGRGLQYRQLDQLDHASCLSDSFLHIVPTSPTLDSYIIHHWSWTMQLACTHHSIRRQYDVIIVFAYYYNSKKYVDVFCARVKIDMSDRGEHRQMHSNYVGCMCNS